MVETVGLIAACVLPFWNIPLIVRIGRRGSSRDVSLWWTFGIWGCFILMLPSGLASSDIVFKTFAVVNMVMVTAVVIQVVRFRRGDGPSAVQG